VTPAGKNRIMIPEAHKGGCGVPSKADVAIPGGRAQLSIRSATLEPGYWKGPHDCMG